MVSSGSKVCKLNSSLHRQLFTNQWVTWRVATWSGCQYNWWHLCVCNGAVDFAMLMGATPLWPLIISLRAFTYEPTLYISRRGAGLLLLLPSYCHYGFTDFRWNALYNVYIALNPIGLCLCWQWSLTSVKRWAWFGYPQLFRRGYQWFFCQCCDCAWLWSGLQRGGKYKQRPADFEGNLASSSCAHFWTFLFVIFTPTSTNAIFILTTKWASFSLLRT